MSEYAQCPPSVSGPQRALSTDEIQKAFAKARPRPSRKRSNGVFEIAEDATSTTSIVGDLPLNKRRPQARSISSIATLSATSSRVEESLQKFHNPTGIKSSRISQQRFTFITPICEENRPSALTSHISHQQPKKSARTSLARVLKRFPLQIDHSAPQVPNFTIDREGPATGKENAPPGMRYTSSKASDEQSSRAYHRVTAVNKSSLTALSEFQSNSCASSRFDPRLKCISSSQIATKPKTRPASRHRVKKIRCIRKSDIPSMPSLEVDMFIGQAIFLHEILSCLLKRSEIQSGVFIAKSKNSPLQAQYAIEHPTKTSAIQTQTTLIDEYVPRMKTIVAGLHETADTLQSPLGRIGCELYFAAIFIGQRILDDGVYHLILAFLASRVLVSSQENGQTGVVLNMLNQVCAQTNIVRRERQRVVELLQSEWKRNLVRRQNGLERTQRIEELG